MVRLTKKNSSCEIVPEVGGNLCRLMLEGHSILRTPDSMEALVRQPEVYGLPILFPPNRIDGGTFSFDGRTCRLPLNEPARNNHLHGLARTVPWQVADLSSDTVSLKLSFGEENREFAGYPFAFELNLTYVLEEGALTQKLEIINRNGCAMPCGTGIHSAFNAPERMRMDCENFRWEILPPRYLPTGKTLPFTDIHPDQWFSPNESGISMQFPMKRGSVHAAELDYGKYQVIYQPDGKYNTWCLWNCTPDSGFVCPEPMNMLTNEYNLHLPEDFRGTTSLEGGKTLTYTSVIRLK